MNMYKFGLSVIVVTGVIIGGNHAHQAVKAKEAIAQAQALALASQATFRAQVVHEFKDPESAKWREFRPVGEYMCGEVNSKNSYGAFIGYRRVMGSPVQGQGFMIEPTEQGVEMMKFNQAYDAVCDAAHPLTLASMKALTNANKLAQ